MKLRMPIINDENTGMQKHKVKTFSLLLLLVLRLHP